MSVSVIEAVVLTPLAVQGMRMHIDMALNVIIAHFLDIDMTLASVLLLTLIEARKTNISLSRNAIIGHWLLATLLQVLWPLSLSLPQRLVTTLR
eukprot:COSAG06_NODE_13386_length_1262_cov_1.465176_2_plen_94_part_00